MSDDTTTPVEGSSGAAFSSGDPCIAVETLGEEATLGGGDLSVSDAPAAATAAAEGDGDVGEKVDPAVAPEEEKAPPYEYPTGVIKIEQL